jgi:hypothetical protein
VSQRNSEAPTFVSNWICLYRFPALVNGPMYLKAVGWFLVPSGYDLAR